jgi:hypothetical protein
MKLHKLLLVLLITVLAFSVASVHASTIKPSKATPAVKEQISIQKVYNSQLGVRELSGKNDGKAVEAYLATVQLDKGYAWCAAFVKWCYLKSNVASASSINAMALSVNKAERHVYFKNKILKEPQPGDAFTLYYAHLGRIGHTGFFDRRINNNIYRTVEGNTNEAGSREGDGVYAKIRSFKSTYSINRYT